MFPGAKYTRALECLMPDLKSVQIATSHSLGQNFSSVFGIKFKNRGGEEKTAWQACNGITTRVIGAMIMMHSDNKGLITPPKISPVQCVFIGRIGKGVKENLINKKIKFIEDERAKSEKEKVNYYTLIGVPLIIKRSNKDFILIRRDSNETIKTNEDKLVQNINENLDTMQKDLLKKAKRFMQENTSSAESFEEFKNIVKKGGFIKSYWCGNVDCAKLIKKETKNSLRVVNNIKEKNKKCIFCNKEAEYLGFFAPAY
jgi:prolyl-tRNA synthetase